MTIKRLLAATDFSPRATLALERAAALSEAANAELHLLYVADDDLPSDVAAQTEARLRQIADSLCQHGDIRPLPAVAQGPAFQTIVQTAKDCDADLIVMGAHRRRVLRDIFVGTTLERVMRTGHLPVLMVNRPVEAPYRRVLIATDMSDASAHAVRAARSLGFTTDTEVTVFHAYRPLGKEMMVHANIALDRIDEHVASEIGRVQQQLAAFVGELDLADTRYQLHHEEGDAIACLVRAVDSLQPDLLVIGTHGHSGVRRALLGSVAEAAIKKLNCDILAVPPRAVDESAKT